MAFSSDSLLDILELIERIAGQTAHVSKDGFLADADIQDATAYRILSIGETCRSLPDDLKPGTHISVASDCRHAQYTGARVFHPGK